MSTSTPRIAFLDEDHVMQLVRTLLAVRGPADEQWLRDFFAPEPVDVAALLGLGVGLREADGAAVALALADGSGARLDDANVLFYRRGSITRELLAQYPDLKLVQKLGEDASGIDLHAAAERGIEVSCLPRRTLRHASENVMALMLAVVKQVLVGDRMVRAGVGVATAQRGDDGSAYNWVGLENLDGLDGKTLGLVGCGEIGTLVARRAQAFGMRVIYTDRIRIPEARERELGIEFRTLEELLPESDVVSIHVPGNPANGHLIGSTEIAAMRPGARLINTSRGIVVDEDALYSALVSGHLAGAGLDVHDPEPRLRDDRFCHLDNVVLTPHVSGGSRQDVLTEIGQMYDNVRSVLAGRSPVIGRVTVP